MKKGQMPNLKCHMKVRLTVEKCKTKTRNKKYCQMIIFFCIIKHKEF